MNALRETGIRFHPMDALNFMMQNINSLYLFEMRNKRKLEDMAETIASNVTGLPKEMFKAEYVSPNNAQSITNNPFDAGGRRDNENTSQDDTDDSKVYDKFDLNDAIESQIPMQVLGQGAAQNTLMNFDPIAEMLLEAKVPPEQIKIYRNLSKVLSSAHFLHDFYTERGGRQGNMASNEFLREEWKDESGNKGKYKIYAKAITFPLLVYELVSGGFRQVAHQKLQESLGKMKGAHERFNSVTGSKEFEALGWHMGIELHNKFENFVKFVKTKYPNVDRKKVIYSLYGLPPSEKVLFFNHLSHNDFEEAMETIKPNRNK